MAHVGEKLALRGVRALGLAARGFRFLFGPDELFHCRAQTHLFFVAFADVGGNQADRRCGLCGKRTQCQLQGNLIPVARTQGNFAGAASDAACLQKSVKGGALRRNDERAKGQADDFLELRLQQIREPAIAIENRTVSREGDGSLRSSPR